MADNDNDDEAFRTTSRTSSAGSRELRPIRTGRETPPGEVRPKSKTSIDENHGNYDMELKKKDPLPPIGINPETNHETAELEPQTEVKNSTLTTSENTKSTHRPRILNYKRELDDDEESTFTDDSAREEEQTGTLLMNKEVHYVTGADGSEKELISIECQTEWSWLDDMKSMGKTASGASQTSNKSRTTAKGVAAPVPLVRRQSSFFLLPSSSKITRGVLINEETLEYGCHDSELDFMDSVSASDKKSLPTPRMADSKLGGSSTEAPFAVPSRADEYGIPILHLSSDSEDSDDDSLLAYQMQFQGTDNEYDEAKEAGTLPSIGPPQILQYQRESKKKELGSDAQELKLISDKEFESYKEKYGDVQSGMFEGECEFCHENIKPFPSLEDQKTKGPSDLYCCAGYSEFVHFMVSHPLHVQHEEDKQIDIKPHPPYGSKQARRMAKERAAQRMRERELARQQAQISAGREPAGGGGGGGGGNFYQLARQMKTINYQLSSQKCLEEGWTIRPPSPLMDDGPGEVFEPEPILPAWADAEGRPSWGEDEPPNTTMYSTRRGPAQAQQDTRKRQLILKYYENGSKFIILFPDGTGNVFYRSGRPAITISSLEQGLFSYIVTEDEEYDERGPPGIVAVFEPNGHGVTYFNNGQVRICLDQIGGIELDPRGGRRRKWNWKEQIQHVHAPPLQPITFAVTPNLAVRIMSQDNITLTFTQKTRSCRFQMGARLKLVAPENMPAPEFDEDELFRNDVSTRIESLFSKVGNLLKFPNVSKARTLPTPPHLVSKEKKLMELKADMKKKGRQPGVVIVN